MRDTQQIDELRIPFGKFKGQLVVDLDYDYLVWLSENVDLRGALKDAVELLVEEGSQYEKWGSGYRRKQ